MSRFSPTMFQEFFDILIEQSLIFANELEKIVLNGNEIIFLDYMTRCAVSVACGKNIQFFLFVNYLHIIKTHLLKQVIRICSCSFA